MGGAKPGVPWEAASEGGGPEEGVGGTVGGAPSCFAVITAGGLIMGWVGSGDCRIGPRTGVIGVDIVVRAYAGSTLFQSNQGVAFRWAGAMRRVGRETFFSTPPVTRSIPPVLIRMS
jgi:hypothetical protein